MKTELTANQVRYIEALAEGQSLDAAAKSAGIVPRTGRDWRKLPHVQAALRQARTVALGEVTTRSVGLMNPALVVLASLMVDKTIHPSVRVTAARVILESGVKFSETLDLAERVAALEESQKHV